MPSSPKNELTLHGFTSRRLPYVTDQERCLEWLALAHADAEASLSSLDATEHDAFRARITRLMERCACGPEQLGRRSHAVSDLNGGQDLFAVYDLGQHPHGKGMGARMEAYAAVVNPYFEDLYRDESQPPSDLIHVSCTGYLSPSGAQRVVANRGWGESTRVTHAYHMGCYAALPAIRLASAALHLPAPLASGLNSPRVDVVHTELCSLHLDPSQHSIEQLVVQSLFADGLVRYSLSAASEEPGLKLLAQDERILPDTAQCMSWSISEYGMLMGLSREVPDRIAGALRGFVIDLYRRAERDLGHELTRTIFAVHPGGPKILDKVQTLLELADHQLEASRGVLYEYGNMSSATLPHIWMRIVEDAQVPKGTLVASLAFGPGLTLCGALFQKQ